MGPSTPHRRILSPDHPSPTPRLERPRFVAPRREPFFGEWGWPTVLISAGLALGIAWAIVEWLL